MISNLINTHKIFINKLEVDGIVSGPGGKDEEEKESLSQISMKINIVYGFDFKEEDKVTL
jgi:hypothetical protein